VKARMFQRSMTAGDWSAANPILGKGEIGYDETNNQARIGDGVKRWLQLPPIGVTLGQIEQLVDAYLAANPPQGGGGVSITPDPDFNGSLIITVGGSGGGTPTPVAPSFSFPTDPDFTNTPLTGISPNKSAIIVVSVAGTPTPTLQWQRTVLGSLDEYYGGGTLSWENISGATNASYTALQSEVDPGVGGRGYRAVATNSAGSVASFMFLSNPN